MKYMNNHFRGSRVFCKMPMNIQFFADGGNGDDGAAGGGGGSTDTGDTGAAGDNGNGDNGGNTGGDNGDQNLSEFDKFLKDTKNQSEFDRRVAQALKTQETRIKKEYETTLENQKTEAEKLAKMTAEEKEAYQKKKTADNLAEREAQITRRELTAQAKETLADKGLPLSLADVLNYTNADECNKSIEAVEKAFQEAVQKGVEEKLAGGKPPKKAPEGGVDQQKQIYDIMAGKTFK